MEQFDEYVEALEHLGNIVNIHAEKYGIKEICEGCSCLVFPLEWSSEYLNSIRSMYSTDMCDTSRDKVNSLLRLKTNSLHKWVDRMNENNFDLVVRIYAYSPEEVGYFIRNIIEMEDGLNE